MRSWKFKGLQARRRREELGLTAREIAAAVGVSESAICAFERSTDSRQPRSTVYIRLCQALDVDPDALREPHEPIAKEPAA